MSSSPLIVVLPWLSRRVASMRNERGQRIGGGAAEHAGVQLGGERLHRDHDVHHARAGVTVAAGTPTAAFPVSHDQDGVRS